MAMNYFYFIPSGNVAPMSYPLLCASFAIKTCDHGQDVCFNHKMKHKVADKTSELCFVKEFKAQAKTLVNTS